MEDGEPDAVNKLPWKQSPIAREMEKEEVKASHLSLLIHLILPSQQPHLLLEKFPGFVILSNLGFTKPQFEDI